MSHEGFDPADLEDSRNKAMKLVKKAADNGDPIAKELLDLEELASPYYLGQDVDPDDTDLTVWP